MRGAPRPARRAADAFLLLEVIIALTVFSLVAVGLAVALQSSIDASNRLSRDLAIREGLEGMLVEAQAKPKTNEMAFSRHDEKLDLEFRTELEALQFTNSRGEPVDNRWLLRA
ncbi:hypothetical protein BH23VER1_BH23VER1_06730 [soil metagenome]